MKKNFVGVLTAVLILSGISSCNSNASNSDRDRDTATRTSTDTAVISGTPGPSGSQPGPGDTTQAHRDSLKHQRNLLDTTKEKQP